METQTIAKKIVGKFNVPSSDGQIENRQVWPVWYGIEFDFKAVPGAFSVRLSDVVTFIGRSLNELIVEPHPDIFTELKSIPDALLSLGCPEWSVAITYGLIENAAKAISKTEIKGRDWSVVKIREDANGYVEGFTVWDLAFTK